MHRVRRVVEVEKDILDLADWIARNSSEAAIHFLEAAEETISSLKSMPGKGSIKSVRGAGLGEIRSWAVQGFPNHLILYEIQGEIVLVWAVIHGARNYSRLLRKRRRRSQ